MMKIAQKRIAAEISPELLQAFQKEILTRFSPLIDSMKKEYWSRISLPSDEADDWITADLMSDDAPPVLGDLVMTDPDTLLYYMFKKNESMLEAGIVTRRDVDSLTPFCSQLLEILEASEIPSAEEWEDVSFNEEIYETIREVSHVISPRAEEIEAAGFLEDETGLRFLERIKSTEATSLYKLVDAKELPKMTPIVDDLEKMGLLTKDFVVLCSKTGQPILKVSSRSAIEETSNEANKCFICGKPLSQEKIDEIVSVSDFGRKLVDDSYWLPVRVLSALKSFGVPYEEVFVQVTEHGIINLFLILNEQSYLITLCNRKLTLDDAYFISAYISAFSINHALVICTQKLSAIMQRHIKDNNKDADISFIDSMKNLNEAIACYLLEREKDQLVTILEPFTALTPVKIQELVLMRVAQEKPALIAEMPASAYRRLPSGKPLEPAQKPSLSARQDVEAAPEKPPVPSHQMPYQPAPPPPAAVQAPPAPPPHVQHTAPPAFPPPPAVTQAPSAPPPPVQHTAPPAFPPPPAAVQAPPAPPVQRPVVVRPPVPAYSAAAPQQPPSGPPPPAAPPQSYVPAPPAVQPPPPAAHPQSYMPAPPPPMGHMPPLPTGQAPAVSHMQHPPIPQGYVPPSPPAPPQQVNIPENLLNVPGDPSDLEDIDEQLFMMEEVFPMDENNGI